MNTLTKQIEMIQSDTPQANLDKISRETGDKINTLNNQTITHEITTETGDRFSYSRALNRRFVHYRFFSTCINSFAWVIYNAVVHIILIIHTLNKTLSIKAYTYNITAFLKQFVDFYSDIQNGKNRPGKDTHPGKFLFRENVYV